MGRTSEEIVISGISGRFPESSNVNEFRDNLLNNVNMVTANDRRFKPGLYGVPEGFGTLVDVDKFDAEFFRVPPKQAERMDPQLRMALEVTFEALQDAGVNPDCERGTRTGVFFGACGSEAMILWNAVATKIEGMTATGCISSMLANRISYSFDWTGPSMMIDTACSSSIVALEAAVSAMRAGKCDAAVVAGSSLILGPHATLAFQKLGLLAPSSACKVFDESGDGYVRADAIVAIYLQKKQVAKRVYAEVLHVKTNTNGYGKDGISFPSAVRQEQLIKELFEEAGVNINQVNYLETHGTGTVVGDSQELTAILNCFGGEERCEPLLMGSVKSNMGHSEGASGLCGLAKILVMLQEGQIPANLHFITPIAGFKDIPDGRIKVVDKNTEWKGGLVALNNFGIGGSNGHVLLKPSPRSQTRSSNDSVLKIPRLLTVSGRSEPGIQSTLSTVADFSNPNLDHLLNDSHRPPIRGHNFRAFSIPDYKISRVKKSDSSEPFENVWFIFNAMGSQWAGMGRDLLSIPVYAKSIKLSADVLITHFNYDLMAVLDSDDSRTLDDDPTNCVVAITAIQIALIDLLQSLGVKPTGLIGHSAGEVACAYADGCLTAQEAIACACYRRNCLDANNNRDGSYAMAAIGDTFENVSATLPQGVYIACHNGIEAVTISGPGELVNQYVAEVTARKKFAKEVNSCGIAFHSPYITYASQTFLASLQEMIQVPKPRSSRWISSSIPKAEWGGALAQTASAEYFSNNFNLPVLFYDAVMEIPNGSTIIEVGGSGLLKGLIKQAVPTCEVIALQNRGSKNGVLDLLTALGQMFINKVDMDVNKLYGELEYPVPLGTPMIGPLVTWNHEKSWDVPVYGQNGEFLEGVFDVSIENDKYLKGHQIQGRTLFPAAGYMFLTWKFFSMSHQRKLEDFPVVLEDVKFKRVTILRDFGVTRLRVNISDVTGYFEIKESNDVLVTGIIRRPYDDEKPILSSDIFQKEEEKCINALLDHTTLEQQHVYKQFRFLGYEYSGMFKGIKRRHPSGAYFSVDWNDNWVTFLESFLQGTIGIPGGDQVRTRLPAELRKVSINPSTFLEFVSNNLPTIKESGMPVVVDDHNKLIRCRGVELHGYTWRDVADSSSREPQPTLATYSFTPFIDEDSVEPKPTSLSPLLQMVSVVMENMKSRKDNSPMDIIEFTHSPAELAALDVKTLMRVHFAVPIVNYEVYAEGWEQEFADAYAQGGLPLRNVEGFNVNMAQELAQKSYDLIVLDYTLLVPYAQQFVRKGGFILLKLRPNEMKRDKVEALFEKEFTIVGRKVSPTMEVYLARKNREQDLKYIQTILVTNSDLTWVDQVREALIIHEEMMLSKIRPPIVYLVANGEEGSGLLGLTLCVRKEPFASQFRCILSRKKIELNFENPSPLLASILQKDLAINVIDTLGRLGCYMHFPAQPTPVPVDHAYVGMDMFGTLSTLRWFEGYPNQNFTGVNESTLVNVLVSAINNKDLMVASGRLQPEKFKHSNFTLQSPLGIEFSGVTPEGRRVCGLSPGQSLSTDVLAASDFLWDIPEDWSFEEAATVPVVYSTVYLALVMKGQIREGESILIHSGTGGIGLAAINVALSMNCQVFVTVGTAEKTNFLHANFPKIPKSQIGNSRDLTFEQMVLSNTAGRGVDVVLNSLVGDQLQASVRCLARHGRFLEIGRADLLSNNPLGMSLFLKGASYHGVMLDALWDAPPAIRATLNELVQNGLDSGVIRPLPFRLFKHGQVEPAFRYLSLGRHIGKVLVRLDKKTRIPAIPQVYFDPLKSYIVFGGLGGIGLEFINWMVTRHARKILISNRSGVTNAYQKDYINQWRNQGVVVDVIASDASKMENARKILEEAEQMGIVGGIFNLAMHLDVGLMTTQTKESFLNAMTPKFNLTRNMDILTREYCHELDYFAVFSSVASGLGIDGQANYGYANSSLERLIEDRREDGLPGKALQFGLIGGAGVWQENFNTEYDQTHFKGFGVQSIRSVLKSMDFLMSHPAPVMLSWKAFDVAQENIGTNMNLSITDRIAVVLGHKVGEHKLNPNSLLSELGIDSVMAIEIRVILEQDNNLNVSAVDIQNCSLQELEEMAAKSNPQNNAFIAKPSFKSPTAELFQINFMRKMDFAHFLHEKCLYPINPLAVKNLEGGGKGSPNGSIFIVNSFEGPKIMSALGKLLHLPAYVMQTPKYTTGNNIKEITDLFYNELRAVEPKGPYILAGYSAGVYVALELGFRLQPTGENEKLILLDMSPERFRAIVEENGVGQNLSEEDDIDLFLMFFSQIFGRKDEQVQQLLSIKDKDLRMEESKKLLLKVFVDDTKQVDAFYEYLQKDSTKTLMKLFFNYQPGVKYEGQTVLVRTTQNLIEFDSTEYWGLENFCKDIPIIKVVDTTHSYLVVEPKVREVAEVFNYAVK